MHLAALAAYVGSCLYVIVVLLPCAGAFRRAESRQRFLARGFRVQNPIAIGSLGVVVITGSLAITDAKARLGSSFFVTIGRALAIKLTLAFVIINIATYISLGLAQRVVRAYHGCQPPDAARLASTVASIRLATLIALALTALATWLAVEMQPALYPGRV